MIWLTWRQFRAQAITAAAALAAFAILLVVTESRMSSLFAASGITTCHGGTCAGAATRFLVNLTSGQTFPLLPDGANAYVILYFLSVLVILAAPAIIGVFWGAPLIARELESGTNRLAWNQSITRTRWLAVKLTLIGLAAMAVTQALSLLQGWWAAPIGKAVGLGGSASIMSEGRFGIFIFPTHGITPLGYAAFGFALGVTAGLLIRRAIPAMAVTLAIFAVAQFATPLWIRPHLIPPHQTIATLAAVGANLNPTGGSSDRGYRHRYPGPARRLDHVQRRRQRRRAAGHRPGRLRVSDTAEHQPGRNNPMGPLPGQPRRAGGRKLPAGQPLLAPPAGRDRVLPGSRSGPGLVLLLAAQPPPDLTRSA